MAKRKLAKLHDHTSDTFPATSPVGAGSSSPALKCETPTPNDRAENNRTESTTLSVLRSHQKASVSGLQEEEEEEEEQDEEKETPSLPVSPRHGRDPTTMAVRPAFEPTTNFGSEDFVGVGNMERVLKSVVKVFVTSTSPNYAMPWQMKHQQKSTASGFAIEGRRLLTNAHAVAHHTLVMVRKHGNPKKYVAKVEAMGHECDIALMTVADSEFWEGMLHLELSNIPQLQEVVTVVGYPTGGDNVSVTKGVVSRLEMQQYSHAAFSLLAIQIDAAINSGNSGGPALKDDKVIGIAFETLESAENIGYIIPVPVIEHFLEDISRHGLYTGFCDLGIFWQIMENIDLREYCGMLKEQTGILINRVQPLSQAKEVIKPGDILLAFDGVPIADDGTVPFRAAERIEFAHLVAQKFLGDSCKLRLLRDRTVIEAETPIGSIRALVPVHLYDWEGPPGYFIYAGLVFISLSQPFLRAQYGKDWENKAPYRLCEKAASGILEYEDQQVVLLSQVLAAEINNGYQNIASLEVVSCNDVPVRNLQHLAKLVLENKQMYLSVEFDKQRRIVVNVERANAVSAEILKQNFIPSAYPQGLLEQPPGGVNAESRKQAVANPLKKKKETEKTPEKSDIDSKEKSQEIGTDGKSTRRGRGKGKSEETGQVRSSQRKRKKTQ